MAAPVTPFPLWAWFVFGAGLLACVAVDLILHRGARLRSHAAAITWTGLWIGVGLGFTFVVWGVLGGQRAWEYVTAYLVEDLDHHRVHRRDDLAECARVAAPTTRGPRPAARSPRREDGYMMARCPRPCRCPRE
jgi:hypothetical protein